MKLNHGFHLVSLATCMIAAVIGGPASSDPLQAQQRIGAGAASNKWEVLEGCPLVETGARDGDRFHVRHRVREFVRLDSVDATEDKAK